MGLINKLMDIVAGPILLISLVFFLPPYYVFKSVNSFISSRFQEDLANKVVLIVGASSGIGEACYYFLFSFWFNFLLCSICVCYLGLFDLGRFHSAATEVMQLFICTELHMLVVLCYICKLLTCRGIKHYVCIYFWGEMCGNTINILVLICACSTWLTSIPKEVYSWCWLQEERRASRKLPRWPRILALHVSLLFLLILQSPRSVKDLSMLLLITLVGVSLYSL